MRWNRGPWRVLFLSTSYSSIPSLLLPLLGARTFFSLMTSYLCPFHAAVIEQNCWVSYVSDRSYWQIALGWRLSRTGTSTLNQRILRHDRRRNQMQITRQRHLDWSSGILILYSIVLTSLPHVSLHHKNTHPSKKKKSMWIGSLRCGVFS